MSEGEWDNQAPAVKTATHLSPSDSTEKSSRHVIVLMCLMAEKGLHPGRLPGLVLGAAALPSQAHPTWGGGRLVREAAGEEEEFCQGKWCLVQVPDV